MVVSIMCYGRIWCGCAADNVLAWCGLLRMRLDWRCNGYTLRHYCYPTDDKERLLTIVWWPDSGKHCPKLKHWTLNIKVPSKSNEAVNKQYTDSTIMRWWSWWHSNVAARARWNNRWKLLLTFRYDFLKWNIKCTEIYIASGFIGRSSFSSSRD